MNFLRLILGLALLTTQLAYGARHCKTERIRSYAEQLATLDPKADLDILDLDFFSGGSVVAGYEYEVEPAYTKGLYSRSDSWLISAQYIPSTAINIDDGFDIGLSLGPKVKNQATFIRFFKDPCEAMLANPYSPRRIPLRTSVALGPKFKKGDYFLFRGSVGFVVGAEILSLLGSSVWGLGLSGSYLIEGFYQVHIVRLDEKHIRMKVVAHRNKNIAGSLGLGYESDFEVFGISLLDNRLEKFVNTKPIKIKVDKGNNKVFLVDYVLDLTDKEVASAFEKVIKKVSDYRFSEVIKPFNEQSSLLLDLSPLEAIYRNDYSANSVGRLKRNLKTTSEQDSYGLGLHAGNKIFGFKLDSRRASVNMSISQPDDSTEKFVLKSWDKNFDSRFLYSWHKSDRDEGLRALFKADNKFQEFEPVNVVKYIRHKKNRFTYRNFLSMKKEMKKALPAEIYEDIPWNNWQQGRKQKFLNYGLRYELILSPEALNHASGLTQDEIKAFFLDQMKRKGLTYEDYFTGTHSHSYDKGPGEMSAKEQFDMSLRYMSKLLAFALDKNIPSLQRMNVLTKLRRNTLFAESGFSFLMGLAPDKIDEWYHLDLDISSNEALIDYSYGDSSIADFYKKILTIKAALDDEALDLLREAESLSLPEAG
ncbi:MAG: hypothetical protein ACLGHN_00380 [Bacteriovoracia bacterium]